MDFDKFKYNGDIFLYYGNISRYGYNQLSDIIEKIKTKKETGCLILGTLGGVPDAAYRIARAMQHHYNNVEILIPSECKSAGTLLCIGAKKIILGDRGELGPLDIQLSKPDEMFGNVSGLDIIQALSAIEKEIFLSFRKYLLDICIESKIRTKTAAEIATQLAQSYITPISSKIDPLTLGEHYRAIQIASEYGNRLNEKFKNLKDDAINKLISAYPCHNFVIDRKEARTLFNNISTPEESKVIPYCEFFYEFCRSNVITKQFETGIPSIFNVHDIVNSLHGITKGENEENQNDGKPMDATNDYNNGTKGGKNG